MIQNVIHLLRARRFLPLFTTQFLGAFNDSLFKQAVVLFVTYQLFSNPAKEFQFSAIAQGLFILPFFIFSALSGQLADDHDKARLIRIIKLAEIEIMIVGGAGIMLANIPLMLVAVGLMGVHSTFFGPIKYAILPQHLQRDEVLGGTGLVEAGTYIAILGGTILAGVLALLPQSRRLRLLELRSWASLPAARCPRTSSRGAHPVQLAYHSCVHRAGSGDIAHPTIVSCDPVNQLLLGNRLCPDRDLSPAREELPRCGRASRQHVHGDLLDRNRNRIRCNQPAPQEPGLGSVCARIGHRDGCIRHLVLLCRAVLEPPRTRDHNATELPVSPKRRVYDSCADRSLR